MHSTARDEVRSVVRKEERKEAAEERLKLPPGVCCWDEFDKVQLEAG